MTASVNPEELYFDYDKFDPNCFANKAPVPRDKNKSQGPGKPPKKLIWFEQPLGYNHDVGGQPVAGRFQFKTMELNFGSAGIKEETSEDGRLEYRLNLPLRLDNQEELKIINMAAWLYSVGLQLIEGNADYFRRPGFKADNPAYAKDLFTVVFNPDDLPPDPSKPARDGPSNVVYMRTKILNYSNDKTQVLGPDMQPYDFKKLIGRPFAAKAFVNISHIYIPNGNVMTFQIKLVGLVLTKPDTAKITSAMFASTAKEILDKDPEAAKRIKEELTKEPNVVVVDPGKAVGKPIIGQPQVHNIDATIAKAAAFKPPAPMPKMAPFPTFANNIVKPAAAANFNSLTQAMTPAEQP